MTPSTIRVPLVRRAAALLAARLDAANLAVLFADHDPHVRAAAASSAGRASEAALVRVLESDPHPMVRLTAAQTLGLLAGREAEAALIAAALDDAEPTVRARALRLSQETLVLPKARGFAACGARERERAAPADVAARAREAVSPDRRT